MRRLPEGAWDAHAHIIDNRFPLWSGRDYDPPSAPLHDYLALLDRHGIARGVLVQPSVYGHDNRCMLDALDRAEGRLVGVAVPHPESSSRDLEAMQRRGVRAVRYNRLNRGGLDYEVVIAWQPVLEAIGWHVEMHTAVERIADLRALIDRFSVPVVIDHMGRPEPGRADPASRHFMALTELVHEGRVYVKLSAPYRLTNAPPPWRDVTPLARALVTANPAACVWATDWPHTQTRSDVVTEDLIATLDEWCPDETSRKSVLTEGAEVLYGG